MVQYRKCFVIFNKYEKKIVDNNLAILFAKDMAKEIPHKKTRIIRYFLFLVANLFIYT